MDFLNAMGGTASGFFGAVIPFLIVLSIVVFVHEMGHFLVGRWCGSASTPSPSASDRSSSASTTGMGLAGSSRRSPSAAT